MGKIVKVPFRTVSSLSMTNVTTFQVTSFALRPNNLGDVAANTAAGYHHFRVRNLRVRFIVPSTRTSTGTIDLVIATAYTGDYDTTGSPATFEQMSQWDCFAIGSANSPPKFSAGAAILLRQENEKWWVVQSTGGPNDEQFDQGRVWLAALTSAATLSGVVAYLEVSGMLEFTKPVAPAISVSVPAPLCMVPAEDVKADEPPSSGECVDSPHSTGLVYVSRSRSPPPDNGGGPPSVIGGSLPKKLVLASTGRR